MSAAATALDTMPVAGITVEDRHRRDMGDLDALAESIQQVGLLQPIVVTGEGRLISGQRRLEAVKRLGWTDVDVHVVTNLDGALGLVTAERDENTCRKDMTPTELQALGRTIEALHQPEADARREASKARPGERVEQGGARSRATLEPKPKDWKREEVGKAVGVSGAKYKRAQYVVTVAEEGRIPSGEKVTDAVQQIARKAQAEMDRTGKVFPAYEKVNKAVRGLTENNGIALKTKTHKGRKAEESARQVVNVLTGLTSDLDDLDLEAASPDTEEAARWERDLSVAVSVLNRFRKRLKEYSNG